MYCLCYVFARRQLVEIRGLQSVTMSKRSTFYKEKVDTTTAETICFMCLQCVCHCPISLPLERWLYTFMQFPGPPFQRWGSLKSGTKKRGFLEGGFCKMYVSLGCGARSAKSTAGANIPGYSLFPWPWHWTRQKPPLLKPPFLGSRWRSLPLGTVMLVGSAAHRCCWNGRLIWEERRIQPPWKPSMPRTHVWLFYALITWDIAKCLLEGMHRAVTGWGYTRDRLRKNFLEVLLP